MIRWIETSRRIEAPLAEYQRLLGYPRDHMLTDRARELVDSARAWYAAHGRPWMFAGQVPSLHVDADRIDIAGERFTSKRLAKMLFDAQADSAVLVAVSAGPELEAEAQRLWTQEKPDEYFFLEVYGSAVVEYLVACAGARIDEWAKRNKLAALPHYSPGYPEWEIAEQSRLMDVIVRMTPLPGELSVLSSGMLRPKKSLLAVFGLTPCVERVRPLTDLQPCNNCSLAPCEFRRAPYQRDFAPDPQKTSYRTSRKALRRWSSERLTLEEKSDGTVAAVFRYEGTTCRDMGHALRFNYIVRLGASSEGYRILDQRCELQAGEEGYQHMCQYLIDGEELLTVIAEETPLLGQRLDEALAWDRPAAGAGCYCEAASRSHKWGIVLETIHFALAELEKAAPRPGLPVHVEEIARGEP